MNILNLCGPVVLYLGFSIIQIIIDIFREHYNVALLKFIVMIIFSVVLNILCQQNLGIIAWMIVFIPFIFMTVVTTLLLTSFGLDPRMGRMQERNLQIENLHRQTAKRLGRSVGDEIADNLYQKFNDSDDLDYDKKYPSNPYKKHHHHHHHKDSNGNIVGGCAGTRYGCCEDGTTSSNSDGSNCPCKPGDLGCDKGSKGPQQNIGGDPSTWGPSNQQNIGGDPNTWGPSSQQNIGGDPNTWGPSNQQNIGGDPNTWGPSDKNKYFNPALDVQAAGIKEAKKMYKEEQQRGYNLLN